MACREYFWTNVHARLNRIGHLWAALVLVAVFLMLAGEPPLCGAVASASPGEIRKTASASIVKPQTSAAGAKVMRALRRLQFEPNRGLLPPDVKYIGRTPGYSVLVGNDGLSLMLSTARNASWKYNMSPQSRALKVLRLAPIHTSAYSRVEPEEVLPGTINYFLGSDPRKWRTNIPIFGKIVQRAVWPGIDIVWYGNHDQLECDFQLAPGATPRSIEIALEGANGISLGRDGNLFINSGDLNIKLLKPLVYQRIGNARRRIEGRYLLLSRDSTPPRVTFTVGDYDHTRPLVIDPVISLVYSTYLGGSGGFFSTDPEHAYGIAVDSSGSAYVTGVTQSSDFPTFAAYDKILGGSGSGSTNNSTSLKIDAFVSKFTADGSALVYSTYLGGSNVDEAYAIAVDSAGSAYITGETFSSDYPVINAYQSTNSNGTERAFVTKLSPNGGSLVFSTYLGGGSSSSPVGGTWGQAIAVDSNANAYVAGSTHSTGFPTLTPIQSANNGIQNAFVTKFGGTGKFLVFSTYLGGGSYDAAAGIAVDPSHNVYITGTTTSSNFPVLNAYQSFLKGPANAFVAKIAASGTSLIYSTYLGGTGDGSDHGDYGHGIAASATNAYVTGQTYSHDFPILNAYQSSLKSSSGNAFVTSLGSTGGLVYSTYLGGSGNSTTNGGDSGNGIAVDSSGSAYIAGQTFSTDFPLAGPFQGSLNSAYGNAFVTKLNAAGNALIYSTFLGGSGNPGTLWGDVAYSIAIDSAGNSYLSGSTESTDFPIVGAFQGSLVGSGNAFLSKLSLPATTSTPTDTPTATSTASSTPTSSPSATPTSSPTVIATDSMSPTPTPSTVSTGTPTPTPSTVSTGTPTPTPSTVSTGTPTPTPSIVSTDTATATATTPTPTAGSTPIPSGAPTDTPVSTTAPTDTQTPTASDSPTPTATSTAPAATPTPKVVKLRAALSGYSDGSSNLSFAKPTGVLSGDVLLAQISASNTGSTAITLTPPTGWSLVTSTASSKADRILSIYLRIAGTSEPASYMWTSSTPVSAAGGITAYFNVNSTKRLDVVTSRFFATASTNITAPSVTTTANNDQELVFMTSFLGEPVSSWTLPTAMTPEWIIEDAGLSIDAAFMDTLVPVAGATGTRTSTLTAPAVSAVSVVTLIPSP